MAAYRMTSHMSKDDTYISDVNLNTKKVNTQITDPVLAAIVAARPFGAIPVFAQELKETTNLKQPKALDGYVDSRQDEKKAAQLTPNARHARLPQPPQLTLLPTGFQVETKLLTALQFEALVRFAEEVLEKGYTIFGSFTQYLVWCMDRRLEPTELNTIKKFADVGFPMPADLDILDPNDTLLSSGIHVLKAENVKTIVDTELTYTPDGASESKKIIPEHSKHEISMPGLLPIKIRFDKVKRKYMDPVLLDFDVNGLMFNKKQGLLASCDHSADCKSLLCKLTDASRLHDSIVGIINRSAEFIGTFEPGPHMYTRRKLFLSRIKKMLIKGWKIKYWDEEYPHVVLTARDSVDYKTCKICMTETKDGDKHYLLRCNGSISTNGICEECFWKWLNDATEKGRYVKCPLCREERLIFGNECQLNKQKEAALKAKVIKVEQILNGNTPHTQARAPRTRSPNPRGPRGYSGRGRATPGQRSARITALVTEEDSDAEEVPVTANTDSSEDESD